MAAIALAATVAQNLGDAGRTLPGVPAASAATVLERAAVAAERRTFTPPRSDQWFYFKDRFIAPEGTFTEEGWRRADGGAVASIGKRTGGQLRIDGGLRITVDGRRERVDLVVEQVGKAERAGERLRVSCVEYAP